MPPSGPKAKPREGVRAVELAVRTTIKREASSLHVRIAWGHRWYEGTDLVLAFGAFQHHVGVEFWRGTTLSDPAHLLEGTGVNLRHVKLRTVAEATAPRFRALVRAAVALDARSEKRPRPGRRKEAAVETG